MMTKVEGCIDNLPCPVCLDGKGEARFGSEGLMNHLWYFHKIRSMEINSFYNLAKDIAGRSEKR